MLWGVGCAGSPRALPQRAEPFPEAPQTLIWHGHGEAWRLEGESWKRTPEQDYELTVVQRRYADRWESTKELHRRHPDYKGEAGPRDQTMHFTQQMMVPDQGDQVQIKLESTLGDGAGQVDRTFVEAKLQIKAEVSSLAPFNEYVIEQHYGYGEGRLSETVRLQKREGGVVKQWVKMKESATLFAPTHFDEPPTQW